jgi:hypothetical protein
LETEEIIDLEVNKLVLGQRHWFFGFFWHGSWGRLEIVWSLVIRNYDLAWNQIKR